MNTARERVLILSDRDDRHALAVLSRLCEVTGNDEAAVLFDTASFPMATDVAVGTEYANFLHVSQPLPAIFGAGARDTLRAAPANSKKRIELRQVRAVYWRRPRAPLVDDALESPELRRYAAKSSWETITGIVEQLALECRVVDPPAAVFRAGLKALQVALARRAGLNVPSTVLTNSPETAAAFVDARRSAGAEAISKSPSDLHDFSAKTGLVDVRRAERLDLVRLSPAILQERIAGGPDLRLVVVGSRIFGTAQTPSPGFEEVDCRTDPDPRYTRFEPSRDLQAKILDLQRRLGLAFGVYDFKCDGAGVPYFLEVNPAGQWLSVELFAQAPIAEALARYLWNGPGAEWETTLPPITERDLEALPAVTEKRLAPAGSPIV